MGLALAAAQPIRRENPVLQARGTKGLASSLEQERQRPGCPELRRTECVGKMSSGLLLTTIITHCF